MTPIRSLIVVATFAYCMALYPAVLKSTTARGADAPVYWRAAHGDTSSVVLPRGQELGWVYSDRLLPALSLAAPMGYPVFLLILHTLNSLGMAAVMYNILGRYDAYPIVSGGLAFVLGAKASDIVAGGNVTPLLCGLSITPLGALAACAVKPYFAVALVVHAALWADKKHGSDGRGVFHAP